MSVGGKPRDHKVDSVIDTVAHAEQISCNSLLFNVPRVGLPGTILFGSVKRPVVLISVNEMVVPYMLYRVSLETELQKYSKLRVEDISAIQQWLQNQPHLPPVLDIQIAHFLHASNYDVDLAKKTIYKNIKYKTTMPEFFANWSSQDEVIDFARKVMAVAVLPKQSVTDSRILLVSMREKSAECFDFSLAIKLLLMTYQSILLVEGQQREFKMVIDSKTFTFAHLAKCPLLLMKKHHDYGEKAASIKVMDFHFLNPGSVMSKIMALCRTFSSKERMKMVNCHNSIEDFFKHFAPETVPCNYGGTAPSSETLSEENIKRIQETKDSLVAYSEQKLVESKIPGKKEKQVEVTQEFRKLELD